MSVTRDDVAKLAGVSPATVSYVINNGPRPVSEATRNKVVRAIEQLEYRPSAVARSLKTNRTCTVGIVISDIVNPILALIAQSIEDVLFPQGYSLILCNTKESAVREEKYFDLLIEKRADGLIVLPTGANRRLLFSMADSGKRMVLLDRRIEGLRCDYVLFGNEEGAYEAVSHLVSLGHTRIGTINLPPSLTPGRRRLRGFECALRDAGLHLDPSLVKSGSFTAEEAESLVSELFKLDRPPTALLVCSNRLARGVLQFVQRCHLRMPDDLALCVFDDVDYYSHVTPSITAVAHDYVQFGQEAARLLMEQISGEGVSEPQVVTLSPRLQVRESTAGAAAALSG